MSPSLGNCIIKLTSVAEQVPTFRGRLPFGAQIILIIFVVKILHTSRRSPEFLILVEIVATAVIKTYGTLFARSVGRWLSGNFIKSVRQQNGTI